LLAVLIPKIRRSGNQISLTRCAVLTIDALGDVDNVALDLTLAALKSRRIYFRFYETHLPAIQANTQTSAWFSCPHESERGPRNPGTPAPTWPQTLAPKARRNALPAPYAGVALLFPTNPVALYLSD
jgi:hypothetical protein